MASKERLLKLSNEMHGIITGLLETEKSPVPASRSRSTGYIICSFSLSWALEVTLSRSPRKLLQESAIAKQAPLQ